MKIWLLNHTFYPARGGIENYLRGAARVLGEMGNEPIILCRRHLPELPEEEEREGIKIIRHPDFPVPSGRLFHKHFYLTEKLAEWLSASAHAREGLVISRFPHYQAAVSRLARVPPTVYMPASVFPGLISFTLGANSRKEKFFYLFWKSQIRALEKEALKGASRVTVFSRNMMEQLVSHYRLPAGKVEVNPPGVDSERFKPGAGDPEILRKFGLRPDMPVLLYLGRLSPEKNLPFLIEAVAPLLAEDEAVLLVVGEGPEKGRLEEMVVSRGLANKVVFSGGTDEPEKYYRLSDIFLSPSLYESFGQSILEAMASGLPVIALEHSPPSIRVAAPEIIEEGESGFCIPARPAAMREKVELLLTAPRLRREMGAKGRAICRERYSWERHVSGLIELAR